MNAKIAEKLRRIGLQDWLHIAVGCLLLSLVLLLFSVVVELAIYGCE